MLKQIRLKNSLLAHEAYNSLTAPLQLVLLRLLFVADVCGVFDARPIKLACDLFPRDDAVEAGTHLSKAIEMLQSRGVIKLGVDQDGMALGVIVNHESYIVPNVSKPRDKAAAAARYLAVFGPANTRPSELPQIEIVAHENYHDAHDVETVLPVWTQLATVIFAQTGFEARGTVSQLMQAGVNPALVLSKIVETPLELATADDEVIEELTTRGIL